MVFEVGDIVPLYATVSISGVPFDLSTDPGTSSGTVIDKVLDGLTTDLVTDYIYRVKTPNSITLGSGTSAQSEDEFWLTEDEINGINPSSNIFDLNGLNDTLGAGLNTVSNNKITIQQTLNQTDSSSPYSDDINRLLSNTTDIETFLLSSDTSQIHNNPTEQNQTATVISGYATTGAFSSDIFKEISDNLYGYYTVVNEVETELKNRSILEAEQETSATADDQANFTVYFNTYVNNSAYTGLLSPKDTSNEITGTDLTGLIDDSALNADVLISGSLGLESN